MTRSAGIKSFKYFVGINSLDDIITSEDRICVLNILGGESRTVTPISHEYSGGNIVFGTSPGRLGQDLKTRIGAIPVYNNVREGMKAGHRFNVGVIYLPPAAVRDGVAELIRVNPELNKIVILTEKVSVHDAREIRALAQQGKVDIFGANCLGVADSHKHIRIGGALGGNSPEETLLEGSVAIFSNSGNFTTTIAVYLAVGGWGSTVSVSSGKDVYIHYAAPEFAHGFANDERSKCAVMYVEPGGYYEQNLHLTKPVIACVVGRWKARLTRAVGHAGAIAGSGDDAFAKEQWFKDQFGVDEIYTPENPVISRKGAVVTNISHIPDAMTAVMALHGVKPDFEPRGDLTLKPWFGNNQGLDLPPALDIPVVEALAPYNEQIETINRQVGTLFPRQVMKDASGCSAMDPLTQVTRINGVSILDASKQPFESNACLAIVKELNNENENILFNVALGAHVNLHGDPVLAACDAAREAGNTPNSVLATACSILGPGRAEGAHRAADTLIELFAHSGLKRSADESFDFSSIKADPGGRAALTGAAPDKTADEMIAAIERRGGKSVFLKYLKSLDGYPSRDAVLAAITTTIAWGPLMRKRVSRLTVLNMPWYVLLYGAMIGASVSGRHHGKDSFYGIGTQTLLQEMSMTELAYLALTGARPTAEEAFPFQVLLGLILSNGPGTISAQGAKGGVSADGPEAPERVQINKGMTGFLTHTGYAHGGNGFEGIRFLIDIFSKYELKDAGERNHGLDLDAIARAFALEFKANKARLKAIGLRPQAIPGVNHPVFKGQVVNHDPREVFISGLFDSRDEYNVFHDFYRRLVRQLFDTGVTRNTFCVNIDAVIATLLLKLLWPRYRSGDFSESKLESAAFTVFLFGRMVGSAGEIDDHINRGRNMDTRTATSKCSYVS